MSPVPGRIGRKGGGADMGRDVLVGVCGAPWRHGTPSQDSQEPIVVLSTHLTVGGQGSHRVAL